MSNPAWEQIRAGVGLMVWSKLAKWDVAHLRFLAAEEDAFEVSDSGHKEVHGEFGRLICWIVFSVGSEYLVKGVCSVNGMIPTSKPVLQIPSPGDDIDTWIQRVINRDAAIREHVTNSGGLGKANEYVRSSLKLPPREKDFAYASIDLLRGTIRNRDAHRYAQNERAIHFHLVPNLLVPAFNILLGTLDEDALRSALSKH